MHFVWKNIFTRTRIVKVKFFKVFRWSSLRSHIINGEIKRYFKVSLVWQNNRIQSKTRSHTLNSRERVGFYGIYYPNRQMLKYIFYPVETMLRIVVGCTAIYARIIIVYSWYKLAQVNFILFRQQSKICAYFFWIYILCVGA